MKTCVLIGGGNTTDTTLPYETKAIDEEIIKLGKKEHPIFLYIGLASTHSDSKYDQIKKIYQNLGCTTEYCKKKNLIHNRDLGIEKISRADIIYIGGGDTIKLLEEIKEYDLEKALKEAYEKGTILVGKSAGAILLSKEGFSDSYILRGEKDHYDFVKGLNFVSISISPHYKESVKKDEELKESLKGKKKIVYGIPNGTALIIEDDILRALSSVKENHVYECSYEKEWKEKKYEKKRIL